MFLSKLAISLGIENNNILFESMEAIRKFVKIEQNISYDDSYNDGAGDGSGYGFQNSTGDGSGHNYGSGYGHDAGYGYGSSVGHGDNRGSGYSHSSGYSSGIKSINGMEVYIIDGIQTIILSVRNNITKGFILSNDLTLTPCYIVKENGKFAHGNTLKAAFNALKEKLYTCFTVTERISKFKEKFTDFSKKYPARELFIWHHILTGSCQIGRESFCKDKGIDIQNDEFTIHEFVEMTQNQYEGEIIKLLEK